MKITKQQPPVRVETFGRTRWYFGSVMGLVVVCGLGSWLEASTPKTSVTSVSSQHISPSSVTKSGQATRNTAWQRWSQDLQSPRFWERSRALQQLSRLTGYRSQIHSTLLTSLHDSDPRVQITAIVLLGQQQHPDIIPALLKAYSTGTYRVKQTILRTLGLRVGRKPPTHTFAILPVLLQGLQEPDLGVQKQAIVVLGWLGGVAKEAIPVLIKMAQQPESPHVVEILRSLGNIGSQVPASRSHLVPIFQQTMISIQPDIREVSIRALGRFGSQVSQMIPALRTHLSDTQYHVRKATLWALAEIGVKEVHILAEIYQRFEDPHPSVRIQAQETLSKLGSPAIAMLKKGLRSNNPEIRRATILTLGNMGDHAHSAGIALVQRLKDEELEVRIAAAQALCRIKFTKAIWPLIRTLRDKDWQVREGTASALSHLEKTAHKAVPELARLIYKDEYYEVRLAAIRTLAHLRVARWTVAALWRKGLRDNDAGIRELSAVTLGRFGEQANAAVRMLGRSLRDDDYRVRKAALVALRQIGSSLSVRYLAGLLHGKDAEFQWDALLALKHLGHKAKSSIPLVLKLLRSPVFETRVQTIHTLAQLGQYKGKVIHALQKALEGDSSPEVRQAAHQAIKHLQSLAQAHAR